MGRVTLLDVARHAGVSRATASLVLNSSPLVAGPTRAKVEASMSELGYVYDRTAASLRTSRSGIIGVVAPEFSHPYLSPFVAAVQDVVERHGLVVLAGVYHEDAGRQARLVTSMIERGLDGLVIIPANGSTRADLGAAIDRVPVVQLVRQVEGFETDVVRTDNAGGARQATEHLIGHGAKRIAFVGGMEYFSSYRPRLSGVQEAAAAAGLADVRLYPCAPDLVAARAAAHLALDGGADALVCYSDLVAQAALDAVAESRAPGAVPVVGFDDVPEAAALGLTTVASHAYEAGEAAGQLLSRRIAESARRAHAHDERHIASGQTAPATGDPPDPTALETKPGLALPGGVSHPGYASSSPQEIVAPTQLVVRSSCGCPANSSTTTSLSEENQ